MVAPSGSTGPKLDHLVEDNAHGYRNHLSSGTIQIMARKAARTNNSTYTGDSYSGENLR
jgi:hypothetical protein